MMDLRLPSGLFFTVIGLILVGLGIFASGASADLLTDVNVNLYAGAAMLAFGVILLMMAKRASGRAS